jgi:hypothetical protein
MARKTPLFAPFIYTHFFLPRQARDKHRESTQKRVVFCAGKWLFDTDTDDSGYYAYIVPSTGGPGEKTALFAPFIYKKDHFTKTGSGQT